MGGFRIWQRRVDSTEVVLKTSYMAARGGHVPDGDGWVEVDVSLEGYEIDCFACDCESDTVLDAEGRTCQLLSNGESGFWVIPMTGEPGRGIYVHVDEAEGSGRGGWVAKGTVRH